ncbi:MAG TPA: F0F1 ATP synthase subunit delta [Rhodanobacteraceae bacterium]|nr:F0F1 ATP synthase subunit delta [Rhodanobacteraceae bacterium]
MDTATLARPYARAAFELAGEHHTLDDWSAQLAFAAAVAADPRVASMHNDPRVDPGELAAMHRPQGLAADAPFGHFLALLADNRRLALLPDIAAMFESLRRAAEHTVEAHLRVAAQPDAAQAERLAAALKQRCGGAEVTLDIEVDPSMLGGAVLDIGGQVIDTSMRARLAQLQSALMR